MEEIDDIVIGITRKEVGLMMDAFEWAVHRWCNGDYGLAHGLVLEHHADGRKIIRVKAGAHWRHGQAGAGPVVLEWS